MDNTAEGEVDDDLFGSEDQSDGPEEKVRELSDRELDSGDDEDRDDRAPPKPEAEEDDLWRKRCPHTGFNCMETSIAQTVGWRGWI